MKYALALAMGIAVVPFAAAPLLWSSAQVGAESAEKHSGGSSDFAPLETFRTPYLNERALWLVDPMGLALAGALSVDEAQLGPQFGGLVMSHEWTGSSLKLVVAGSSVYETTIRVERGEDGKLAAAAAVAYRYDAWAPGNPPSSGKLSQLSGTVGIKAGGWWEDCPTVCLSFRLHGFRDGSPEWVQGQVTVP